MSISTATLGLMTCIVLGGTGLLLALIGVRDNILGDRIGEHRRHIIQKIIEVNIDNALQLDVVVELDLGSLLLLGDVVGVVGVIQFFLVVGDAHQVAKLDVLQSLVGLGSLPGFGFLCDLVLLVGVDVGVEDGQAVHVPD